MLSETLPLSLQRLLPTTNWQADTLGMSSAQTFRIEGSEDFYLKIAPVYSLGGLQAEANALVWLGARLPAPEVVFYERLDGIDYLLIRTLPGLPASDKQWQSNPQRLSETLADSMQRLHALDLNTCPFDQRTATKIREVANNIEHGLVDVEDFDPENCHLTPDDILKRLYAEQPPQDDLVVTHGDFCLPNLILDNWSLSGFIDVGSLGVGDRYQDLALCARSLTHNLGTDQYNDFFFEAYGITHVDEAKLSYFRLLDELK